MGPPAAEFTVICIDNASKAFWHIPLFRAQIEAAEFYCETVFKCNPKSKVSIVRMSLSDCTSPVTVTGDIDDVHDALEDIRCHNHAETSFKKALAIAWHLFSQRPSTMKKRLLMFVTGTNDLDFDTAKKYGKKLKHGGVALDIFNFYLLKMNRSFKNPTILTNKFHYARLQLHELYTTVNTNNNSRIDDAVVDDDVIDHKSFVIDTLSEYVLKRHLHYLKEKAPADDGKKADTDLEKYERSVARERAVAARRAAAKREVFKSLGIP